MSSLSLTSRSRLSRPRRPARLVAPGLGTALVLAALAGLAGLAGCSGGSGTASSDAAGAAGSSVSSGSSASRVVARSSPGADALSGGPRLLIATGTVELRSRDVARARARIERVVDRFRGEVAEQQSESDGHGELAFSRLVLRIPTADFAAAVTALEETADLVSSDTHAEDVTTQVIDTRVDLRVQRRSIARVAALLDRARSIRDIVAIEAQLSRRQARLGSLERRAAYLADQTAMSTVTVSVDRRPRPVPPADGAGGFLGGLHAGWDALATVAAALATTAGAVLPFAVVLLVLLAPARPLARRLRRRRDRPVVPAGG